MKRVVMVQTCYSYLIVHNTTCKTHFLLFTRKMMFFLMIFLRQECFDNLIHRSKRDDIAHIYINSSHNRLISGYMLYTYVIKCLNCDKLGIFYVQLFSSRNKAVWSYNINVRKV